MQGEVPVCAAFKGFFKGSFKSFLKGSLKALFNFRATFRDLLTIRSGCPLRDKVHRVDGAGNSMGLCY